METYNLFDIANPKQWKTISSEDFDANGKYNVYGANGIIGKTNTYNHKEETVLITCRGATCGTVNLSEPYSYINGNAMALDDLDKSKAATKYVYYFFQNYNFNNVITGSAQPQITREGLRKVEIPLPDLETQNKIVAILDKAKAILDKREQTIKKYDELLRAVFLDMFGDPVVNPKRWEVTNLGSIAKIGTGGTPSRGKEELYYNGNINWAKTTEVKGELIYETEEKITELALEESNCKIYPIDTILIAMYGQGKTRGNVGLLKIESCTNQACAAIPPSDKINQVYLFCLLKLQYLKLRELSRGGNQENLNLSIIAEFKIPNPPVELQDKFEKIFNLFLNSQGNSQKYKVKVENLANSLSQLAFKGELTFNTAVDLEVLLENDYTFFKEKSTSKSIQLLLERLDKDELNKNRFSEQQTYDKAKSFVFELLKEGKVKQVYDEESKQVKLTVSETA